MKIRYFFAVITAAFISLSAFADEQLYYPTILEYTQDSDLEAMANQGIIVFNHRNNMALACIPYSTGSGSEAAAKRIKNIKGVKHYEGARKAIPMMDIARTMYDADKIGTGEGLPSPYTGKGIVAGFCDIGFDPMHINFLDANGNTRVKQITKYDEEHASRTLLTTQEEMEAWETDYTDETHATHVAGILAGHCEGSPYTGMAPEADIVASVSDLYDVGILAGAEDIIAYAKSVNKPCVINMSLGAYTGPHDGTSLFNRYLAALGEEAIICISSGNGGTNNTMLRCEFNEAQPKYRVRIHSSDWQQFNMYGQADCWSDDDTPFTLKMMVLDGNLYRNGVKDGSEIVWESDLMDCSNSFSTLIYTSNDEVLSEYFTGAIQIYGGLNSANNRRYITTEFSASTSQVSSAGNWARYVFVIEVAGTAGKAADLYSDNSSSWLASYSGYPAPTTERSISDMATGDNIISVGMYNTRETIPYLSGDTETNTFVPGYVNKHSSYGTLLDGRILPHTVAPGGGILSSYSTPYIEEYPDMIQYMSFSMDRDNRTYYWGNEVGTSMSSPYTAGCVATWLEANPELSISDVLNIISTTNLIDYPTEPTNPRHGQGWLQPYAAIIKAIDMTIPGVNDGTSLVTEESGTRLSYNKGTLTVWNPSSALLQVSLYNISGMKVLSTSVNSPVNKISLNAFPAGIYIARCGNRVFKLKIEN